MQNKPVVFFFSLIAISAIVLVIFQITNKPFVRTTKQAQQTSPVVLATYRDNCARCHGAFGEGFATNPALQGRKIPSQSVKTVVQNGRGKMPAFPNIPEPMLSQLSEFVSTM